MNMKTHWMQPIVLASLLAVAFSAYSQDVAVDSVDDQAKPPARGDEVVGIPKTGEPLSTERSQVREHYLLLKQAIGNRNKLEALMQINAIKAVLQHSDGGLADVVLKTDAGEVPRAKAMERSWDAMRIGRLAEILGRPGPIRQLHISAVDQVERDLHVLADHGAANAPHEAGGYGGYAGGAGYGGGYGGYGRGAGGSYDDYGGSYSSGYGGGNAGVYGEELFLGGSGERMADESDSKEKQLEEQINMLVSELRRASTDSKRKIVAAIRKLVSEQFDRRTDRRIEQLDELKKRLTKLHQKLNQRNEAKDEIVDVRVKTYVNRARGLGF